MFWDQFSRQHGADGSLSSGAPEEAVGLRLSLSTELTVTPERALPNLGLTEGRDVGG